MAEKRFDVYVSYASEDKAWAERLSKDLLATGLRVFIDRTLDPGADFSATLDAAVDGSDHLVVLWSHHAQRAQRVESAVSRFDARRRAHGNWPRITLVNLDHEEYRGPEPDAFLGLDRNAYAGGPEHIGLDPWRELVEKIVGQIEGSQHLRSEEVAPPPLPQASRQKTSSERPSKPDVEQRKEATVADARHPRVLDPTEHVAAHADNPALVDELGRRPFAEIIAARIEEVRRSNSGNAQEAGAFMVNLHGPWGAGKTSVLNFLKANLQDKGKRAPQDRWVVVEFNAWRHQRLQPPWWSLIKEIQAQAAAQLDAQDARRLRRRWLLWRFRADWLPGLFSVTFIVAALLIMTVTLIRQGAPMSGESGIGKAIELGLGLVSAFVAGGAGIVTLSRSLLFGSATAAQSYMDARSDPLGPIVTLFQHLVDGIARPLAVFIDDLDRCDGDYVIALLEGIQTLLRTRRVTYVVAADRKWICTCFENKYGDFAKTIGEPGRPLGYLFLDKVFQVSAAVPKLSPAVQLTYWQALLKSGVAAEPKKAEEARQVAESQAQEQLKGVRTKEEFDQKIEQAAATGNVRTEQAMRAAVAKQITSPDVLKETEHRLRAFAGLLEPNPRAMKRLVNAYGMYQAAHVLERRTVSPEALARWTIIELRWPLLAECIAARPDLLGVDGASFDGVPKKYARLLEDASVKAVLSVGADGRGALTEQALREIVGDVAADGSPRVNGNALPTPTGLANPRASLT